MKWKLSILLTFFHTMNTDVPELPKWLLSSPSFTYANTIVTLFSIFRLWHARLSSSTFHHFYYSHLFSWFITISLYLFLPICLFNYFSSPSILFSFSIFLPPYLFVFLSIYLSFDLSTLFSFSFISLSMSLSAYLI